MSSISIIITESPLQKVKGIPVTITLTTNVPATVFYTLDGSEPNNASRIATGPINLPTDEGTVTLKAFATDGMVTCPTITQIFGPNFVPLRQPRDEVLGLPDPRKKPPFPFSSSPFTTQGSNAVYGNTGGITIDSALVPANFPDGYDGTGTGTPASATDQPLNTYDLIFSETDRIGQRGRGIGTLPATVTVVQKPSNETVESSDANGPLFNPRALVIFQDGREQPFDPDVPKINRPNFSLENLGKVRDGALLQTSEVQPPSGSLLRQHYNPKDNTITYYYLDTRVNRWIISKEPYVPNNPNIGNLSNIVFSPRLRKGPGFVFKWIPGLYRRLI